MAFEVLLVPTDESEADAEALFRSMPDGFLSIPPADGARREALRRRWRATARAPALVLLEVGGAGASTAGGRELIRDARSLVATDPTAEVRTYDMR